MRPRKDSVSGDSVKLLPRASPVFGNSVKRSFPPMILGLKVNYFCSKCSTIHAIAILLGIPFRLAKIEGNDYDIRH